MDNTLNSALNTFSEALGTVKKTLTQMGLPSSFAPTLDLAEIDKRIADLKAVEQWLIANQTMLRGTIQGLEVQRNTIATVQALSQSMQGVNSKAAKSKSKKSEAESASSPADAFPFNNPGFNGAAWWDLLQKQFEHITRATLATGAHDPVAIGKKVTQAVGKVAGDWAIDAAKETAGRVAKQIAGTAAKKVTRSVVRKVSRRKKD